MRALPSRVHTPLTADGALVLAVEHALAAAVAAWLPAHLRLSARMPPSTAPIGGTRPGAPAPTAARILVREAHPASTHPRPAALDAAPDLVAANVRLWRVGEQLFLDAPGEACEGQIDLAAARATISAPRTVDRTTLHTMLLLASAYLLGRLGRALVHGATLVAPDGRAWLLVGDTHAGKTTTCATLVEAGWRYCADDHAILHSWGAGVAVEGWPRLFHLDRGWEAGVPAGGLREDVDAFTRWPDRWRATAPLGGVLCPHVQAEVPTRLAPLGAADRLAALLRQSPWLTLDPTAAPTLLALLQRVASCPGATLQLGRDTFRRPEPLATVLAPLLRAA